MLLLLLLLCVHRCNCIVMPKLKNEYKNNHFIYRHNSFVFNDDDNITATAPMVARTRFILQMHTGTIRSTLVACATVRSMFFAFVITSCFPLISCCRWLFFAFIFLSGFFCIRCAFVLACYKQRDRTSNIRIWSTSMNFTDDDIEWAWQSSMYSSYDPYRWQWNCS